MSTSAHVPAAFSEDERGKEIRVSTKMELSHFQNWKFKDKLT